jgi:hypothetical protein
MNKEKSYDYESSSYVEVKIEYSLMVLVRSGYAQTGKYDIPYCFVVTRNLRRGESESGRILLAREL